MHKYINISFKNIDTCKILSIFKHCTLVRPELSMSCEKRPYGSPRIICIAEGFYPADLEQQWMRDGEIINSSNSHNENYSTNEDGLFTQKSYLELPAHVFNETIFSCWVNHSSLKKTLVANISSAACYDRRGKFRIISYFNKILMKMYIFIIQICLL